MSSESGERRPARARGMEAETETFPCPRCNSTNTKFCYYNNYNLCQPRYFCKSCRRYWTRGGALRNVPVGGGTRKRSRTSSAAALSPGNSGPVQSGPETMATGPGCEVNLNEAAPEPEPETGSLGGGVEFAPLGEFGLGLEPSGLNDGFEIGLGLCDWPAESVGGEAGNINVGVSAATSWNDDGAWKIGERPLSDGGDCFGFPELAISAPGRKS